MTDVAVIILAKNEQLHIGRCLERIAALSPRQVFVVDCFSSDGTQRIVEEWQNDKIGQTHFIISVVPHEWSGLYAKQFNWALDNLPIDVKVIRWDISR